MRFNKLKLKAGIDRLTSKITIGNQQNQIDSYENYYLSNLIISKCKLFSQTIELDAFRFSENHLKLLIPFAFFNERELKIIDFGGSAGTHYFIIKKLLGQNRKLAWRIVENSQIVELSSNIDQEGLSFYKTIADAVLNFGTPNIGLASSVFEYLSEPMVSLSEFLSAECEIIYLTRTCLSLDSEPFVGVQRSHLKNNGPGELPEGIKDELISYPIVISPLSEFISEIEKRYEIISCTIEKSSVHKFGNKVFDQYGILARRKKG